MPNSPRLSWPYPNADDDPWYAKFKTLIEAQDASAYANREDRQLIMGGTGTMFFDGSSGEVISSDTTFLFSPITGFRVDIPAFDITMAEGQVAYVTLTRAPSANQTASITVAGNVPSDNDALVICIRSGSDVYFRNGIRISSGDTKNIFTTSTGSGSSSDTYERAATFTIAEGSATQTATIGRVMYAGSIVGVTAETTSQLDGGTITVNVKLNGTTKLTAVLDISDPLFKNTLAAVDTYLIGGGDSLTIEVVTAAFSNVDTASCGLTVVVALARGAGVVLGIGGG